MASRRHSEQDRAAHTESASILDHGIEQLDLVYPLLLTSIILYINEMYLPFLQMSAQVHRDV
jgi:hypothetical protein